MADEDRGSISQDGKAEGQLTKKINRIDLWGIYLQHPLNCIKKSNPSSRKLSGDRWDFKFPLIDSYLLNPLV